MARGDAGRAASSPKALHHGMPSARGTAARARRRSSICASACSKMCGVDFTRIDGVDATTALVVESEAGADLSRFPSTKHFASRLGLSPGHQDHRRQAAELAHAAQRQPCGPGPGPGPAPCAWRQQRCAPASRRWARNAAACVPAWARPRSRRRRRTSWRG